MSPRKTRRGKTKGENVNESVSIVEDSMKIESPSVHSRSLRGRRNKETRKEVSPGGQKKSEAKIDSSLIVDDSKRPARRTRGRKTIVESSEKINDSADTSTAVPEQISTRKSGRKRNQTVNQSALADETIELISKKSRGGRGKKLIQSPESSAPDERKGKPSSSDSEDHEVANVSSKMSTKTPLKYSNTRSLRSRNTSPATPTDVTPESSPITVPLTPHRTTKTPRKSPINLGSPKTHSLSPKRLSKTSRKLSVISASPKVTPKKLLKSLEKLEKTSPVNLSDKGARLLVKPQRAVVRASKSKSPPSSKKGRGKKSLSPEKSPIINHEDVTTSIKNNSKSPKLILEKVNSPSKSNDDNDKNENSTVSSRETMNLPLHSLMKCEMTSSTPREIRGSLNSSNTGGSPLHVAKFYGLTKSKNPDESKCLLLEDETNPLISEDDDSFEISGVEPAEVDEKDDNVTQSVHKNSTYELAEPKTPNLRKKKNENDTYELDEPTTPGLRKRIGKRSLSEMNDNSDTEEIARKRVCRVRFATPDFDSPSPKRTPKVMVRSRSATPSSKLSKNLTPEINNITKRRRSNSLSSIQTSSSVQRKRSLSIADASGQHKETKWSQKAQNESINRLSKPRLSTTLTDTDKKKKGEVKGTSSAKKIPNFAQIHQKKFEKMESLVDAKKRVEDRHNAFTSNNFTLKSGNEASHGSTASRKLNVDKIKDEKMVKSDSRTETIKNGGFNRFGFKIKSTVDKSEEKNDEYSRFGFKVRKQEAAKIISRPLGAKLQAKKEEKRMALKGVRSNRRFELLMKSRNIQ